MRAVGEEMAQRDWVKAIGKKLREDWGDCPTLPEELVRLLNRPAGTAAIRSAVSGRVEVGSAVERAADGPIAGYDRQRDAVAGV
jgi:hypothetical protein